MYKLKICLWLMCFAVPRVFLPKIFSFRAWLPASPADAWFSDCVPQKDQPLSRYSWSTCSFTDLPICHSSCSAPSPPFSAQCLLLSSSEAQLPKSVLKKNKVFWGYIYIYIIGIKSALRLSISTTAVQQYTDDREKVPGSNRAAVTQGRKHGCNYFYRHVFLYVFNVSSPPPKKC